MTTLEAVRLAGELAEVATKIPGAVERVRDFIEGRGVTPDDVLVELTDLSRNHVEMARVEALAELGKD